MADEQGMFVPQVTQVMLTPEVKFLKIPGGSTLNLVGSASEQSVTIIMFLPHILGYHMEQPCGIAERGFCTQRLCVSRQP